MGGGSLSSGGSGGFVTAKVPVSWPLRARAIVGSSSALSVVVTFDLASSTKQNVTLEADRNASTLAYQQTYPTTQTVRTGVESMHVRFYSQAGAQGSLVASADASLLVKADGTLAKADGTPLGTIQTIGQVALGLDYRSANGIDGYAPGDHHRRVRCPKRPPRRE